MNAMYFRVIILKRHQIYSSIYTHISSIVQSDYSVIGTLRVELR
jgi:hypothetical protein